MFDCLHCSSAWFETPLAALGAPHHEAIFCFREAAVSKAKESPHGEEPERYLREGVSNHAEGYSNPHCVAVACSSAWFETAATRPPHHEAALLPSRILRDASRVPVSGQSRRRSAL